MPVSRRDQPQRPGREHRTFHAERAWLSDGNGDHARVESDVLIEVSDGRFSAVIPGVPVGAAATDGALRLTGLTVPGLANAHSHAFHRALRGRTHGGKGSFWTWRDGMYALAERLDPDAYYWLARATYAEMVRAGITCVGEFHYLHHGPGGTPYGDPNAMGAALMYAARDAGLRITLLDTLYLTANVDGTPPTGTQLRFSDGTADAWAKRVTALQGQPHARVGVAAHSVRAIPAETLPTVVAVAAGRPMHVHLSEQRAENVACLAVHRATPTQLLADHGFLGPTATAVHATHLNDIDRTALGDSDTGVCFCPTTERDLADGIGPARALVDGGSPLSLGSDSHAVIDMFEEARAIEMHERLRTELRGHFAVDELMAAATLNGHRALGWDDAGAIAVGARADLVTMRLDGVRTAGADPSGAAIYAATAADVTHVVVDGATVVHDGRHASIDVGPALSAAITPLWLPAEVVPASSVAAPPGGPAPFAGNARSGGVTPPTGTAPGGGATPSTGPATSGKAPA
ncbi:MAG TPA: formimidoylglutamate deiminase [Micromonosporaceae bacterium]|jgi:formiminoglutamate deiminase|nr:formimidoylglutamate deiminase [Micromonosporaceae bacterium]